MDTLRNGSEAVLGGAASDSCGISPPHDVVGRSPAYLRMIAKMRKMAENDASVLIQGETGSGKELAARAMHYLGRRREQPFVPLNCGAIPDSLIEAELFGHARGAFTDAKQSRDGLVAYANGGTLFLDEVDALSVKGQVTLLRFLQDRRYRPVGRSREQVSDVRIIAATNKPMKPALIEGCFRSDLFYRLNVLSLCIPPLRERSEDILPLAEHYIALFCSRYDCGSKRLDAHTRLWMQQYAWPGNIRELENLAHRMVLLSDGELLHHTGDLDDDVPAPACPDFQHAKTQAIESFERTYLTHLMAETHGNVSAGARMACKERRALGKLLKKHGIAKESYRT